MQAIFPNFTDGLQREVDIGEAEDAPTGEGGLVVFFHVGNEAGGAVVAALKPDSAFNLDECARWEVCEVGAPFAFRVELELVDEFRAVNGVPEEFEAALEPGSFATVTESMARDGHALAR